MKLNKLILARRVLEAHSQEKIPTPIAYKIMKFMKASESENAFYNENLKKIIEKYALKDEKGNIKQTEIGVSIIPAKVDECNKAIEELQDTEIETPSIKLSIADLQGFQMSVHELSLLDEILEDNKEN